MENFMDLEEALDLIINGDIIDSHGDVTWNGYEALESIKHAQETGVTISFEIIQN